MLLWNRIWSSNCLVFERTHVPLRSMARSSKNMMASIANNYVNHLKAQTVWRMTDQEFSNPAKKSALVSRVGVSEAVGHCVPSGVASAPYTSVSDLVFSHIIDCWTLNTPFENVQRTYLNKMEAQGIGRVYALCNMDQWRPPNTVSEAHRKQCKLNRRLQVTD